MDHLVFQSESAEIKTLKVSKWITTTKNNNNRKQPSIQPMNGWNEWTKWRKNRFTTKKNNRCQESWKKTMKNSVRFYCFLVNWKFEKKFQLFHMVQQTGQLIFGCLFVCPFDSYTKIHQHHHVNNNKSRDNREKKLVALELSIHSMHACMCVCAWWLLYQISREKKTFFFFLSAH